MTKHAHYRKYNDRTQNSSTYHKKDGTPIRGRLKAETNEIIHDELNPVDPQAEGDPCLHCGGATRLIKTPRRCNREHSFCPNCPPFNYREWFAPK